MEQIEKYIHEITHKVEETRDDFIFTTISTFMGQNIELSKIPISKEILCRALVCFKNEHADEYYKLLDESNERRKELKKSLQDRGLTPEEIATIFGFDSQNDAVSDSNSDTWADEAIGSVADDVVPFTIGDEALKHLDEETQELIESDLTMAKFVKEHLGFGDI